MFGQEVFNMREYPGLLRAGTAAFNQVIEMVRMCQQAKKIKSGDPQKLAYVAWAMAHGLSTHIIDNRGRRFGNREEVIQLSIDTLLEGMSE
jgi:hypothetical protein